MSEESLYAEFGLSPDAAPEEIRRAFRFIAFTWERALAGSEEEKKRFRRLAVAYLVLSDQEMRAAYDAAPEAFAGEEKFDLAFDLALRGYDEEMISEYLRRLSLSEETVALLTDAVKRVKEALSRDEAPELSEDVCRRLPAGRGWRWLVEGFALFRKNPLIWVALTVIMIGMVLALSLIPVFGELVFNILFPVFVAGLCEGCRAIDDGEELELAHLFAGFRHHAQRLVAIGGINLLGQIALIGLMIALGGDTVYKMFVLKSDIGEAQLMSAAPGIMLAMSVGMLLSVPLLMLVWFSPLLVIFKGLGVKDAMLASFRGCLKNALPFLVYGAAATFFAFLALLFTFGLGFVVLFPLVITSTYAAYQDIFAARPHIDIEVA